MELEFLAVVASGTSTGQEVRAQYFFTGGDMGQLESTVVISLLPRTCTLECTQQALVSAKD